MQTFHAIKVEVKPGTNTLPPRVKLTSLYYNETLTIPFTNEPGSLSPKDDTAVNYLTSLGFDISGRLINPAGVLTHFLSNTIKHIK